jgi:Phage integrase family
MSQSELPDNELGQTTETAMLDPAAGSLLLPAMVAAAGDRAARRFIDFFTANIRNRTPAPPMRSRCSAFSPGSTGTASVSSTPSASITSRLYRDPDAGLSSFDSQAAPRGVADAVRLVDRRPVVEQNPAAAVRGPKHVGKKGKTPVLDGDEAKKLIDSIDVSTIVGLRDRALIALLIYGFARISAALHMNIEDYYPQGKRWWVRLHEKGGKQHEMPAQHLLEGYLDEYVKAAGIGGEKVTPLFRTLDGRGRKQLTVDRMTRQDARPMIVRRSLRAGIITRLGATHSGRPGSPSICSTAACSNTPSRWRRMRAPARPSSTTVATTWSRSIRSSASSCKPLE